MNVVIIFLSFEKTIHNKKNCDSKIRFEKKNFQKKNFQKKIFQKKIFQKKNFPKKNFPKKKFSKNKFSGKKFSKKKFFPKINFPENFFSKIIFFYLGPPFQKNWKNPKWSSTQIDPPASIRELESQKKNWISPVIWQSL